MRTVIKQNLTLEKLIYNLPVIIFSIILSIRILVAIPLIIVSISKFVFLENHILQKILGVGSIITLEIVLTVLSLLTAEFRRKISNTWANSVLGLVIILTIYTSYMIQSLSKLYVIELPYEVFIGLHLLNIVSVLLSESIGFILKKADELSKVATTTGKLHEVTKSTLIQLPEEILKQIEVAKTNKEKVLLVKDILTQKEAVEFLSIDKSQVSRYYKSG